MDVNPYATLQRRIRNGEYRAGEWLPPERRLASDLGVNRRTVHRAIERLADAGYLRCEPGRRPVVQPLPVTGSSTPTVALLMGNEPMYHAFQAVLHGCEPILRDAGYRIVFMDTWGRTSEESHERERTALADLMVHPVDGIIIWCQSPDTSAEPLRLIQKSGVSCVAIDREIPQMDIDYVGIDNVDAGRRAVEHLLSLGHRRVAFVSGQEHTSAVLGREAGYREALERHGIPVDESLIVHVSGPMPEAIARTRAEELARSGNRPTALFAVNDVLALRMADALRNVGLRIPQDVAIVGFDDMESLSRVHTGLTTTSQPYEMMGQQAARLLCRRMLALSAPIRHVVLPTSLVIRESTNAAPEGVGIVSKGEFSGAPSVPAAGVAAFPSRQ